MRKKSEKNVGDLVLSSLYYQTRSNCRPDGVGRQKLFTDPFKLPTRWEKHSKPSLDFYIFLVEKTGFNAYTTVLDPIHAVLNHF